MYAGVLADVECLQMQAVGFDLDDERIDPHLSEALSAVFDERVTDEFEIVQEFACVFVRRKRDTCRAGKRDMRCAADAQKDAGEHEAYLLKVKAGAKLFTVVWQLAEIALDRFAKLGCDGGLVGAAAHLL